MRGNCPFNFGGGRSDFSNVWNNISQPVCNLLSGGGGIWSNLLSRDLVVNDSCRPLLDFQQIVYELGDISSVVSSLYDLTGKVNSREEYEDLRARFNATQDPVLFMACISCCNNNRMRFNKLGEFNQAWGNRKFNSNQERKLWDFKRRIANKNVRFIHGDYTSVNLDGRLVIASPAAGMDARRDRNAQAVHQRIQLLDPNHRGGHTRPQGQDALGQGPRPAVCAQGNY